ncbi:inositol-3-phosphate synthase [Myceligenerans cantabricum]
MATTAVLGLSAITDGHSPPTGCVTATAPFDTLPLAAFEDIVVGGHDVTDAAMSKRAEALVESGALPHALLEAARPALTRADAEVRPGYDPRHDTAPQQEVAERLAHDITDFRVRHDLDRVVVVDLASTEPPVELRPEHRDPHALLAALRSNGSHAPAPGAGAHPLPPSSVTAYAAILAGAAYAAFTPSPGMSLPALTRLATEAGLPVAGQDGKTGQTWLRTALAPAFAARNLRVLSWAGTNLLGGGDGATLADPHNAASKLTSKSRGLRDLTGTDTAPLHIDNVPDLGDVKVAWDHVHVEGFLGSRLTLQTTWSAYDSLLAAPLVLDLARLLSLAHAAGVAGPVPELGFFFKDPWASDEHDAAAQYATLTSWAQRVAASGNERSA